jgi:hypothetical protein
MIIDSVIGVSTTSSAHSTPSVSMPCPNEATSVVTGSGNVAVDPNVIDIDDDNVQSKIGKTEEMEEVHILCLGFLYQESEDC